jgi:hypothetical protein
MREEEAGDLQQRCSSNGIAPADSMGWAIANASVGWTSRFLDG